MTRTSVPTYIPVGADPLGGRGTQTSGIDRGGRDKHDGIDSGARRGTAVQSTISGRVVYSGTMNGYGNVIDVLSDDGRVRTRYAHLSSTNVSKGATVVKGQVLGGVGNTGGNYKDHLHYEVALDGELIDPTTGRRIGRQMNAQNGGGSRSGAAGGGVVSSDGNTSPNIPTRPRMDMDQAARLRTALDRDQDYYPNYLSDFPNVAYHIKFFMVNPEDGAAIDPGNMDPALVGQEFDKMTKVVIAESGVTAGITIKDTTITSVLEGDSDAIGTNFEMTLVEPLGTSFYDVTYNAANTLGIQNFADSPYFLELSFKGYDEEGAPVPNLLANYAPKLPGGGDAPAFKNGGRWFYIVSLNTVDTNLTEAGAVHVCKMSTGTQPGAGGRDGRVVPEMMTIKGKTLGEMLDHLKESLNKAQERRYMMPLATYDFTFEKNAAVTLPSDPRSWSMTDTERNLINPHILTLDDSGTPQAQLTSTKDILDTIAQLIRATREGNDMATNGVKITDEALEGAPQARRQVIFQSQVDVKNGEYEQIWGQYRKTYTFRITPRFHNSLITDPQHAQEAKSPAIQRDMVKELRDKGLFRKRFDYYYTGMNTEIMNLDIKFNLAWGAVLQNVIGFGYNRSQNTTQASVNENLVIEARRRAEVVKRLTDERNGLAESQQSSRTANQAGTASYSTALSQQGNLAAVTLSNLGLSGAATAVNQSFTGAAAAVTASGRSTVNAGQAQIKSLDQQIAEAQKSFREAEGKVRAVEQDLRVPQTNSSTSYAEDLEAPVSPIFQTRIVQSAADTNDRTGTGTSQEYHRDRAIFGALMEQLAGEAATMMTLEMDIKGDPFWIGRGNVQASQNPNDDPTLAPGDRGEIMFLLKVSYPFNQSENGEANFRNFESDSTYRQDAFTGFYKVRRITSKFSDGLFTQTLDCFRHTMLDVAQELGFGSVEGELSNADLTSAYGGSPASSGSGATGADTPAQPAATKASQEHTMKVLYDKFISMGWTPEGARAMVAQIGRENDYNPAAMFGNHTDAANSKTNAGVVSWQGNRRGDFMAFMQSKGMIDGQGRIVQSDASLRAQAEFINKEMQTSYRSSYNAVRNGSLTYSQLEPILSNNYEGWDRAGNTLGVARRNAALNKMSGYYARIKAMTGG